MMSLVKPYEGFGRCSVIATPAAAGGVDFTHQAVPGEIHDTDVVAEDFCPTGVWSRPLLYRGGAATNGTAGSRTPGCPASILCRETSRAPSMAACSLARPALRMFTMA